MRKHFQKTHVTEAEMCEIHTRRAKDSLTESEGEHSNTHVWVGVYILTQRVQNWGNIFRGHSSQGGVWNADTHAKDIQTKTEGGHTHTHTLAGVYILTQRVQTWGNIFRGHTNTVRVYYNLTQCGETFAEDRQQTARCVKDNRQGVWKTDNRQKWKENTLTLTHAKGFTSWHNVYEPGETFAEDTLWKTTDRVRERQTGRNGGGHTHTHARAGVYIMVKRVQTEGKFSEDTWIQLKQWNKYKICLVKQMQKQYNSRHTQTKCKT